MGTFGGHLVSANDIRKKDWFTQTRMYKKRKNTEMVEMHLENEGLQNSLSG